MFQSWRPLFNVRRTLLHFTRLRAKRISFRVTRINVFMIFLYDRRILTFRRRRLRIIIVNLPRITRIQFRNRFRILTFRFNVFCNRFYVPLLRTPFTIRRIRPSNRANVRSPIITTTNNQAFMTILYMTMANVRFRMKVVTQRRFLMVYPRRFNIFINRRRFNISVRYDLRRFVMIRIKVRISRNISSTRPTSSVIITRRPIRASVQEDRRFTLLRMLNAINVRIRFNLRVIRAQRISSIMTRFRSARSFPKR